MKKLFQISLLAALLILLFAVPASAEQFKKIDAKYKGALKVSHAYIYKGPSKSTDRLLKKTFGSKVKLISQNEKWYKVSSGEVTGYMKKAAIVKYNKEKKHVALTFDDGPNGPTTKIALDALEKNKCRATFFVVGNRINSKNGKYLKRGISLGCEYGNHSYSHPKLTSLSSASIKSQISKTDAAVKKYTGSKTKLVRTPYGAHNKSVLSAIGKPNIFWSVDTLDWKYRDTSRLISYVPKNAKDGDIILMHDIHKTTVNATNQICKKLKAKNFEMVTVTELAAIKGRTLKKGTTYSSIKK